jgi:hypothetical protein
MNTYCGLKVYLEPHLVTKIPKSKTWIDKVLLWNPCNNFFVQEYDVQPSNQVYFTKDAAIMHPVVWNSLKKDLGE